MSDRKTPYHRENLEQALIETAAEIVARRGVDALSLRELGRSAGVSRTAPYHYFADKATLLARVGEQGFERLSRTIEAAIEADKPVADQLRAGLQGYLRFALDEPHFFRLMFANVLARPLPAAMPDDTALAFSSSAARDAFTRMFDGTRALQANGTLRAGDPLLLTNVFWACAHGVAMLALDGHLKGRDAVAVLDAALDGLLAAHATQS